MNRHADELRVMVAAFLTPGAILNGIVPQLQECALAIEQLTEKLTALAMECGRCDGSRKEPEVWDLYHMTDHTFGKVTWRQRMLRRLPPRVHRDRSAVVVGLKPCPICAPLWQVIESSGGES